jgi:hypothetical protein
LESGKGPTNKGSCAWLEQQAKLNGPNPAELLAKQALDLWTSIGCRQRRGAGQPGDKPGISGAHSYEQHADHADLCSGRPMSRIARRC